MATALVATARILVVDDQNLFRSGLVRLLEADSRVQVVGQAVDGLDVIKKVASLKPDVILMLTTFETDSYVLQALRAGASGYVLKDAHIDSIVSSILAVISGERVMASAVVNRVIEMLSGNSTPKEFYDGLTGREIEILKLIAIGQANAQIARRLDISDKTVRNHVSNMYEKLHIYDRSQAVLYAVRKGLVEV